MIKKIISFILCFIFLTQNLTFANDNWIKIEANGKSIDINTSNFAVFEDYIYFFAKAKVKNETYIYNLEVNCDTKTLRINNIKKFTGNETKTISDIYTEEKILPVSPNSLNENMILFIDNSTKNDIRRQDWNKWFKYHIKVLKKIKKNWNPKFKKDTYNKQIKITCKLKIDKNGNLIGYYIDEDYLNKKYYSQIVKSIDNTFLKVNKFEKLPKSFNGNYIEVKIAFVYNYDEDLKNLKITKPDKYGYRNLYVCKHKLKKYKNSLNNSCEKSTKDIIYDTIFFIVCLPFVLFAVILTIIS